MERAQADEICHLVRNFSAILEGLVTHSKKRDEMTKGELLGKILHRTDSFRTAVGLLMDMEKEE